jgi:hypothetical protein
MQAVPFVGSKIANAAGKMAKLIATDMYLDGLGTGSSTLSVDGSNVGPTVAESTEVKFSLIKLNPEMGTDCKQGNARAAVTTERENILRDDATVCSHANVKHETVTEMITAGV